MFSVSVIVVLILRHSLTNRISAASMRESARISSQCLCCIVLRLLVNDDAALHDRGRGITGIGHAQLIVVDNRATIVFVPDLDAEFVYTSTAVRLSVYGRQHKPIVTIAIDRA